jgi:glycosyltransferase involved in cell wall biosynthesis
MQPTPILSIVTPSYGYAQFIGDAIDSVRHSALPEVEHIVVDGASTDGTVALLERSHGPRWVSEPDQGQSDAINKGVLMATGAWIGWLNADEFYVQGGLRRALDAIAAFPDADVIYGDCIFVDEHGRAVELNTSYGAGRLQFQGHNPFIMTCACFIRREVLVANPLATDFRLIMDWELFLRLSRRGARFRYMPGVIGAFRLHAAQVTRNQRQADYDREKALGRRREGIPAQLWRIKLEKGVTRAAHWGRKVLRGELAKRRRFAREVRGTDQRWFAERVP